MIVNGEHNPLQLKKKQKEWLIFINLVEFLQG